MKSSILTIAALSVALSLFGCNKSSTPNGEQSEKSNSSKASKAEWKSVTLRFKGFKKTKSGAT